MRLMRFFFFFKQKTAYEMRISDWSSDVCSSDLFVGVYPNDPDTIAAVRRVADPRVIPVFTSRPGPTTKADCLNHLWNALTREERATGTRFKAVILHDAEDVVHSAELRIFDRLVERFDMVQLPEIGRAHV